MAELADEQNEANARRMQEPDQAHGLAGRIRKWPDTTETYVVPFFKGNTPEIEPASRSDFEENK